MIELLLRTSSCGNPSTYVGQLLWECNMYISRVQRTVLAEQDNPEGSMIYAQCVHIQAPSQRIRRSPDRVLIAAASRVFGARCLVTIFDSNKSQRKTKGQQLKGKIVS